MTISKDMDAAFRIEEEKVAFGKRPRGAFWLVGENSIAALVADLWCDRAELEKAGIVTWGQGYASILRYRGLLVEVTPAIFGWELWA